jgi:hypothetical protein
MPSPRADPGGRRPSVRRAGRGRSVGRLAALAGVAVLVGSLGLPMAAGRAGAAGAAGGFGPRPPAAVAAGQTPLAVRQGDEPLPTPQFGADEIRRRADEILAGPAYQAPEPSFVERAAQWIAEQLRRLIPNLPSPGPTPPEGSMGALNWIAVTLILGVAAFLVYVGVSRWRGLGRRRTGSDPLVLTETEARRLPDEWLAEAGRFEAGGRWRDALRCRFRALVGELIERGVARDLPGRTSGELRRDVRRRAPDAAVAFEEASRLFDDAWYGAKPTGEDESARFRALAAAVLEATKGSRRGGPAGPAPALVVADGGDPVRSS